MVAMFAAWLTALFILIALTIMATNWLTQLRDKRADFIRTYSFPAGLADRLGTHYPQLTAPDRQLVEAALRQFFLAYLKGGREFVSMPSQVADDLWHEFILYTRHYQSFCRQAFGRFLHHTPAVVLGPNRQSNTGLRRVWWYACKEEQIDPRNPARLPLLFALDETLKIDGGFRYAPDCSGVKSDGGGSYCAGDMSSTDFDGTTDGFGDSSSGDGGDGDGGGCGGD